MASDRIETLIARRAWEPARRAIEKELAKAPEDHWLWSRLSGVKYEQFDYQGALEEAERALEIVPDCPLALWSRAGALDMLGRTKEALRVYMDLTRRGTEELTSPDADAEECWEGADWTRSLVVDCAFRMASCLAKLRKWGMAEAMYRHFLDLLKLGIRGIYSREDALARMEKLRGRRKATPDIMQKTVRFLEEAGTPA
jgi:tetratricopeptide (TPR) repeat protein